MNRSEKTIRRRGAAFLAATALLAARTAAASEWEVTASSFTLDNQVNVASATYYGALATTPASPAAAAQLTTPGGLYFDGTRYRVWDIPSGAWVSLTTGTPAGLLPWSELGAFPPACPAGQFVSALGGAPTCTAPSGTLSGGVAGYYGKWTGAAALGIGNLVDNGASVTMIAGSTLTVSGSAFSVGGSTFVVGGGNIGIGTTAPTQLLHVVGNSSAVWSKVESTYSGAGDAVAGQLFKTNGDATGFAVGKHISTSPTFPNYGFVWNYESAPIHFGTSNSERMRIDQSGNVGVGTTIPGTKLEVVNAPTFSILTLSTAATSGNGSHIMDFGMYDTKATITSEWSGLPLRFKARGGDQPDLVVATSGNVGIGTTGPSHLLHVNGAFRQNNIRYSTESRNIDGTTVGNWVNIGTFAQTTTGIYAKFKISGTVTNTVQMLEYEFHNTDYPVQTGWIELPLKAGMDFVGSHSLAVDVQESASLQPVAVRIRVIGANPQVLPLTIEIETNAVFTPSSASGAGATVVPGYLARRAYQFPVDGANRWNNSTNGLFILGGGNVGVGTTNPQALLHIGANTVTPGLGGNTMVIGDAVNTSGLYIGEATKNIIIGHNKASNFNFIDNYSGSSPLVLAQSGGNVGVGTASPTGKLHVSSGTVIIDGTGGKLQFPDGSVQTTAAGSSQWVTNGTNINNVNAGNVGIGTTAPVYKLEVAGGDIRASHSDTNNVDIALQQAGAGGRTYDIYSTGSGAVIGAGKLSLYDGTAGAHRLVIDGSGNVGVGTTSPSYKLQVSTASGAPTASASGPGAVLIGGPSGDGDASIKMGFVANPGGRSWIQGYGTAPLYINELGNNVILNATSGSVGIGTTTPTFKLEVSGNDQALRLGGTASPRIQLQSNTGTVRRWGMDDFGTDGTGRFRIFHENQDGSGGLEGLTITTTTTGGNVGIGTASPATLLDVNGAAQFGSGAVKSTFSATTGGLTFASAFTPTVAQDAATKNYVDTKLLSGGGPWTQAGSVVSLTTPANNVVVQSTLTVQGNAFSVGGSTLVVNGGYVGIGTASPVANLHVAGPGETALLIDRGGTGNAKTIFRVPGTAEWNVGIDASDSNKLKISNDNTSGSLSLATRLAIDSSGNVGIGAASPSARLQVGSGGVSDSLYVASNLNGAGVSAPIQGPWIEWNPGVTNGMTAFVNNQGAGSGGWQFINTNSAGVVLSTPVSIAGGGNVGIGTTSPQTVLHIKDPTPSGVNAGGLIVEHTSSPSNSPRIGLVDTALGSVASAPAWFIDNATDTFRIFRQPNITTSGAPYFQLNSSSAVFPTGSVGIGTPNPATTLEVNGAAQFGSGAVKSTFSATTGGLTFASAFTPTAAQDAATKNYVDTKLLSGGGPWSQSGAVVSLTTPGNNAVVQSTLTVQGNAFSVGGSTFVVSGGNVGVGTASPVDMLTVTSPSAGAIIRLDNGLGPRSWRLLSNDVSGSFSIRDETAATHRLTINTAGNVGIGTASPAYKLDVSGGYAHIGGANQLAVDVAGTGLGYFGNFQLPGGFEFGISTPSYRFLSFNLNTGNSYFNNGNVGVGTTSPIGKVSSLAAAPVSNFAATTPGAAQGEKSTSTWYSTFQGTADNGPRRTADISAGFNGGAWGNEYLSFGVGNGGAANDAGNATLEKMRIQSNGNVGIGTMGPTTNLQVANGAAIFGESGSYQSSALALRDANTTFGGGAPHLVIEQEGAGGTFNFIEARNTSGGFNTGVTEKFNVNNTGGAYFAGNVGIGTTTPNSALVVYRAGTNDPIASFGGTGLSDNPALTVANGSGGISLAAVGTAGSFSPGTSVGDSVIRYSGGKSVLFSNGGTRTDMIVNGSGNVGIGTTAPAENLEVSGNAKAAGFYIKKFTLPVDGNWYAVASAGGQWGKISYRYDNPTSNNPAISSGELMVINDNFSLRQRHKTALYGANNNLQFARSGNATQSGTIWVKASGSVAGTFYITENENCTLYLDGTNAASPPAGAGQVIYPQLGGDADYFSHSVGIGTTTPGYPLDVAGVGRFISPNSGTTGGVVIKDAAGNPGTPILQFVNNAGGVQYGYVQGLSGTGMALMGGNVGVGTTAPGGPLDVAGTAYLRKLLTTGNNVYSAADPLAADLVVGSNADGGTRHDSSMMFWSAGSASRIFNQSDVFYLSTWSGDAVTGANVALAATVGGTSYFQGKVGVGVTAPAAALDVQTATPGLKVGATCVSGTCPSDARLKSDIRYLSGSLGALSRLKPAAYRFKDDASGRVGYGLIAQDLQKTAPEFVREGEDGFLRVDYSPLTMMLLEAVKELKAQNDGLRERVSALEKAAARGER